MSKNNSKNKSGKNSNKQSKEPKRARDLVLKETDTEYAMITGKLGDSRFTLQCLDGLDRIGRLCGSMRGRCYVNPGDLVLVGLRVGLEDAKCDIIHKYNPQEAVRLQKIGEISPHFRINSTDTEIKLNQIARKTEEVHPLDDLLEFSSTAISTI